MKEVRFSDWLTQAFELANRKPFLWLGCVLLLGLLFCLGRISLALNLLVSVSGLFVGVGMAAAIDRQETVSPVNVLKRHLPKAWPLALLLTACWFGFRVVANIQSGEPEKIALFFYHWEFTPDNLQGKVFRQIVVWLYSSAIVAIVFVFLMLSSFGSWFSYPLMVFKNLRWGEAREAGNEAFKKHSGAMTRLTLFLLVVGLIGLGLVPLLTPFFYMLVATLMYVSYRDLFDAEV